MDIQSQPLVLLTRPLARSRAFADQLKAQKPEITCLIAPLIRIEFCNLDVDPRLYGALIFTSINGVLAYSAAKGPKDKTAFCVGDQTAEVAKDTGLRAISAKGTVEDLFDLIKANAPQAPLLHLRGQYSTGDLAGRLVNHGIQTNEAVLYTQPEIALSDMVKTALKTSGQIILPLFSPRTARLFSPYAQDAQAHLHCIAISENVKQAAASFWAKTSRIAAEPDGKSMLDATVDCISDVYSA